MQILATGTSNNRAFTLIELMVVILIIGITISMAVLSFGDFGQQKRISAFAEDFIHYMAMLQEEALLTQTPYAIRFRNNTYETLKYQNKWALVTTPSIFAPKKIPDNIVVSLKTPSTAMIIINSSLDVSPFTLTLKNQNNPDAPLIVIDNQQGTLSWSIKKRP